MQSKYEAAIVVSSTRVEIDEIVFNCDQFAAEYQTPFLLIPLLFQRRITNS